MNRKKEAEKEGAEQTKKDYQSDSLVYALISGMKMYAKNIPGHPMARSSYRRTLKCLHRTLNPGSVWLTIRALPEMKKMTVHGGVGQKTGQARSKNFRSVFSHHNVLATVALCEI